VSYAPPILYDVCHDVLSVIESHFTAQGVTLPERRYVHTGQIVWECEEVVVGMIGAFSGGPGQENTNRLNCGSVRTLEIGALILRCASVSDGPNVKTPPTPTVLDQEARQRMIDGWLMVEAVVLGHGNDQILGRCSNISLGRCLAVGPEGGFAGMLLTIQIGL